MTIQIKRTATGWAVLLPDVGEWLPSPHTTEATADMVRADISKANPGATVEVI